MTGWVNILERVVDHIAVAIKRLRISRLRHNGVRAEETTQLGIIPTCAIVIQPFILGQAIFVVLPGETLRRHAAKGTATIAAVGQVVLVAICHHRSTLIHNDAGTIQMVAQGVEDTVIHPISATAQGITFIVLGDFVRRSGFDKLKHPGDVDRDYAAHRAFDAVPISIINKAGRRPAADGGGCLLGAILVVVGEGGNRTANGATCLVAIGIIAIGVTKGRGDGVFVNGIAIGHRCAVFSRHIADGVVTIAQIVGACANCTVGGASSITGESGGQPVEIVILETLFLPGIDGNGQAGDVR
jgi:hypothetical protein